MFGTSHATHPVRKPNRNVPKRNEFEPTRLLGGIINRTRLVTYRTNRSAILTRFDFSTNPIVAIVWAFKPNFFENKRLVIRDLIEYSFDLHLGVWVWENCDWQINILPYWGTRCLLASKFQLK
jgi:hypothetical protein